MRIDSDSKDTIKMIQLFFGNNIEQVREIFESLIIIMVINYMEGKSTYIPFLGDFKIKHVGDDILKEGKKAKIEIEYNPSAVITKNIGQITDSNSCDLQDFIKKKIRLSLESAIEK